MKKVNILLLLIIVHLKFLFVHVQLAKSTENLFNITHIKDPTSWSHKINKSAVIFMRNCSDLESFNAKANIRTNMHEDFKFLIFCENGILETFKAITVQESLNVSEGHISQFEYFLTKDLRYFFI